VRVRVHVRVRERERVCEWRPTWYPKHTCNVVYRVDKVKKFGTL